MEEMDFTRLAKLKLPDVGEPQDLYNCGELLFYDKFYDRVTAKSEKPLKRFNKDFHKVNGFYFNILYANSSKATFIFTYCKTTQIFVCLQ